MASDRKKRPPPLDDRYGEKEAVRRRDKVIRRMANTPPQPRTKSPGRPTGKKKPSDPGRMGRKSGAGKGA